MKDGIRLDAVGPTIRAIARRMGAGKKILKTQKIFKRQWGIQDLMLKL